MCLITLTLFAEHGNANTYFVAASQELSARLTIIRRRCQMSSCQNTVVSTQHCRVRLSDGDRVDEADHLSSISDQ